MLYDKRWDKPEVKADPFSLESLISWLETMPGPGIYHWDDGEACLLGQWLRTIDPTVKCNFGAESDYNVYSYIVDKRAANLSHLADIAKDESEWDSFGAALTRARKALADSSR